MVAIRAGARKVPELKPADVRFGSKADIPASSHVRFTPVSAQSVRPRFALVQKPCKCARLHRYILIALVRCGSPKAAHIRGVERG
jgi:hypothetical protein